MRRYRFALIVVLTSVTSVICVSPLQHSPVVWAQDAPVEEAAPAELPPADPALALTTQDPTIPVDELVLLLKPLTLEELSHEAAAWMMLLQLKAKEISNAEIAVKRQNLSLAKQDEAVAALNQAKTALAEAEAAQTNAAPGSPAYEEATQKVEEAKENLATAEEAVKESADAKEDLATDETLKEALESSQQSGELETAKELLEQAQTEREELTAGTPAYETATGQIDALGKAIADVEAAQAAAAATVPDTPEAEAAAAEVEAALQILREAQGAIDGTQTDPQELPNQEAADKVDEAAAQIAATDLTQPGAGEGEAGANPSEAELSEKQDQLDTTITQLEESSEVDAEVKEDLLVNVTNLQSEQTALIDRLNAVLKEVARKGGDTSAFDKYIQSISVVTIDAQDTQGLLVRLGSWVQSEQGGVRWGINIGKFVGIVLASIVVSRVLAFGVDLGLKRTANVSSLFRQFATMVIRRGGVMIGVLLALTALEVSLAPILAVVGGASFVLAFALQSNLGNLASGLMLLVYKPFDVGDEVKIGGLWGWVDSITLASTRIKGFANQVYTIPNNAVWNGTIENLTAGDVRKGSILVRVPYDSDLKHVRQVLLEIGQDHPLVLESPAPGAFLWEFSEFTIDFLFGFTTKLDDFWTVWQDMHYALRERFPAENIQVPLPHQHIHLHQAAADNAMMAADHATNRTFEKTKSSDANVYSSMEAGMVEAGGGSADGPD